MYPNLRAEMARAKVTQTDIAEHLGCRVATVNSWMQGQESGFPVQKAVMIKEKFFPQCSIDYLFCAKCDLVNEVN